jgi:hypothetical protein
VFGPSATPLQSRRRYRRDAPRVSNMDRSQSTDGAAPHVPVASEPVGDSAGTTDSASTADSEGTGDQKQSVESSPSGADAIRTEVVVAPPTGCPVARASAATGATVRLVGRSARPHPSDADVTRVVGEIELPTAVGDGDLAALDCEPVFRTESGVRCRFDEARTEPCPCDIVEAAQVPIATTVGEGGRLHLTFHVADAGRVREVVSALRRRFDDVSVRRLRTAGDEASSQHVLVDRSTLTARQLEVLETAFDRGYFDHPRNATGCDVADALDIAPSTFAEHLAAAQRKVLADVLAQ